MKPTFHNPNDGRYFEEREADLRRQGAHIPEPVSMSFPFLKEKATGVVHPWSEPMAERNDLVVGCYNLDGSEDPADAPDGYDPTALHLGKVLPMEAEGDKPFANPEAEAAAERARQEAEAKAEAEAAAAAKANAKATREAKAKAKAEAEAKAKAEAEAKAKAEAEQAAFEAENGKAPDSLTPEQQGVVTGEQPEVNSTEDLAALFAKVDDDE